MLSVVVRGRSLFQINLVATVKGGQNIENNKCKKVLLIFSKVGKTGPVDHVLARELFSFKKEIFTLFSGTHTTCLLCKLYNVGLI